jgi:DNA replication ATP-dependent helicase Dna2
MTRYNLSPSMIARFFYHDCDRYLRYHATPRKEWSSKGIPLVDIEDSPISKRLLQAGIKWEEDVVLDKLKDDVILPSGLGAVHERKHTIESTLVLLDNLSFGKAVFQPSLKTSPDFLQKYDLSPDLCIFKTSYPDLIRLVQNDKGESVLQVIDIKANEKLKVSHRIQTALYTLMLQDLLEKNGIEHNVDFEQAGIWLYNQNEPELFDQSLIIKVVEDFLTYRLPDILKSPIEDLSWHLYYRCEFCEFYNHCRSEATEKNLVSQIPSLSVGGREYLRNAPVPGGVNSLRELELLLNKQESEEFLEKCGSLRNKRDILRSNITALNTGEVIFHGATSLAIPVYEDISIFQTFQSDPISGAIYAAGFRRLKGKEIYGNSSREIFHIAKHPDECIKIQKSFLKDLFDELNVLHDFNNAKEWGNQKSLQTYVFDNYEQRLFKKLLNDALKDSYTAPVALDLLFYFQDTSLSEEETHPSTEISHPLVVLVHEIQKVASLPVTFSYRLPEVLNVFPSSNFDYSIKPNSLFWFEHSNVLKFDAISMAWEGGRNEAIYWVKDELSRRLLAYSSVLSGFREKAQRILVTWPQKFVIPFSDNFNYPELSRLIFITRYESYKTAMDLREMRTHLLKERIREGFSIPLEYVGLNIWKLILPIDSSLFEQYESFSNLLVPVGEEGEMLQIAFDDYKYRAILDPPRGSKISFAMIEEKKVDPKDDKLKFLHLDIHYAAGQNKFKTGDRMVLHPRFTDFTSKRLIKRLTELDQEFEDNEFIKLLRNPVAFSEPVNEIESIYNSAQKYANETEFTNSQLNAFNQMLKNRFTLVWGPPGTGKTHFLSKAILNYVKANRDNGKAVRIGVTAFTHAAIENILVKIQEVSCNEEFADEISIYKLGSARTGKGKELLKTQPECRMYDLMSHPCLIIGGTVYSFNKISKYMDTVDIFVVDEASQMKFSELALGMSVFYKGKRLVLAGDDLQLPPIISGEYPEPEDGLPGLHDSIFTYLRQRDDISSPNYTCQLLENWRMNKTLSKFPSKTLYGERYKPSTEEIAMQQLNLIPKKKEDQFVDWVLDPDYPLVVCILEDVRATTKNVIEAELVAKIAVQLRECLIQDNDCPYPDTEEGDSKFWKDGLFIVSPHHAQIRAVKDSLSKLREWHFQPFVDTVDKMQGQEAQAVIVSYGVSDTETAMNEANFIYSLNRLNVSITRARAKSIVFLSRQLLEPPLDILQNTNSANGFNHMLNLVDFCRRNGLEAIFEIDSFDNEDNVRLTGMKVR